MTTTTTTTTKIINRLSEESKLLYGRLNNSLLTDAAQRLRELDKPDCVWHKVGETFDTACNARYRDGDYSTWKTCPNCGGAVVAVKESI